jgi:hypothetical protein
MDSQNHVLGSGLDQPDLTSASLYLRPQHAEHAIVER